MKTKSLWRPLLLLSTWALLSGCIEIPNTTACAVAGKLSHGLNCAETLTGKVSSMTFEEAVKWLEPSDDHGAAICQSGQDWNALKTALEQACRELGSHCTYKIQQQIQVLQQMQAENRGLIFVNPPGWVK